MVNDEKYMIMTVESYPFGWEVKYFYLPVGPRLTIGDVIKSINGKSYRILDGKTQLNFEDIDLTKYSLFE
ncbi:MAG: hypothetical protein RBQ64_05005 [Candidatus Izemoplasmatales bacterium]|jgi:uncharacterized protein YjhX (UPF0386 family)|uniref:Uncharacterized protein n=1 Tax=Acholeplasma brassicae TaxID=61635 RepID=U4KNX2_9MOLU|nr:hypothetical protein [Paracholeplasma brassicae]MDY0317920.1 hypothetical protein [Candidatus Izemoplasmatales bacterium]CCV66097.1 conserved hypothetical protein [Paracholeplasma brassicae]